MACRRSTRLLLIALVTGATLSDVGLSYSQSVVDIYQRQYYRQQALSLIRQSGERAVPRPAALLPTSADSLLRAVTRPEPVSVQPEAPAIVLRHVQRIPKLGRVVFERQFEGEDWVFLGSGRISPVDTMMTRELRARLQAQFGKPTRVMVDDDAAALAADGDIFQFEYWFILNQEIPLVLTDVNGPFERGIAASTSSRFGDRLLEIRDLLLMPLLDSNRKASFVDYYYDDEIVQWYLTGFDGEAFFLRPVSGVGLSRPVLPPRPQ